MYFPQNLIYSPSFALSKIVSVLFDMLANSLPEIIEYSISIASFAGIVVTVISYFLPATYTSLSALKSIEIFSITISFSFGFSAGCVPLSGVESLLHDTNNRQHTIIIVKQIKLFFHKLLLNC